MNELFKTEYNAEEQTVSGRKLHEALEIKTKYADWFKRMCKYGFAENIDYKACTQKWKTAQGNITTQTDHRLTISMAKEICMIQRSEEGKQFRQYFIKLEEMQNSPEMIMKRALQIADMRVEEIMLESKIKQQEILLIKK